MYDFDYTRAGSLAEAEKAAKGGAQVLAGGHTLIPTLKQRLADPGSVVDIGGIKELSGIKAGGGGITIGATTTHDEVANSKDVAKAIPALAALAGRIGDPAVRNRGTLGGSIANADPAADYPAALLGLGATIETSQRSIAADDFFTAMFETALKDGEIIKSVTFPTPKKAGYAKFPNPASRYAVVGVMVAQTADGVRVAVTGAGPCAFRVKAMEDALNSNFSASALDGISVPAGDLNEDIHASAEYRAHLVTVMAQRAVEAAK